MLSEIELIIMRLHCMSKYITKEVNYFTYRTFMNELEELKKDYYIIGYNVKTEESVAVVTLVKREAKNG